MRSQDFLATVLPSAGRFCAVELSTAKKEHVFTNSVDDLYSAAMAFNEKGFDAYFALASFGTAEKRVAENAAKIKSIFLDIDCNGVKGSKEYANKTEGAHALEDFLARTGLDKLGQPWVISSGGGLHVYWPLTEEVDIAVWKPIAENLKRLAKQYEFKIDHSVTADASRILRVPDTNNYKKEKPRRVKIMVEANNAFDLAAIDLLLHSQLKKENVPAPQTSLILEGARPKAALDANRVKLIENSMTFFRTIEEATDANRGCGQLAYYKEHATEDGMEPLWFALISIAKKCEDGYECAQELGDMHPYEVTRLNDKWNHTKGPTPCVKFDSINPGICSCCPHFQTITNPLQLGRVMAMTTEASEVELQREVSTNVFEVVYQNKPIPPKGFSYGSKGGVIARIQNTNKSTSEEEPNFFDVMILSYDLFVVDILYADGEHLVHMVANRHEGAVDIIFPQKAVISKDETLKALAAQNIVSTTGKGHDVKLFEYVRGSIEYASTNKSPVKVPTSYGWQPDHTFVYSGHIYHPDGKKVFVPMPGLANINSFCNQVGTLEEWRKAIEMLIRRELWDILAMGLVGPASLLMEFTGFNGMTYHMGSSESGTGKSLAQMVAGSFFAHPEKYRVTQSTSAVAIQQRSGMLRNFAIITDEVTAKSRDDFEWLPAYLLDKSQGKGKDRMESGANKERVNTTEWKNMDLLSSNTHVMDYLSGARKHSSMAEILRLLELKLTQVLTLNDEEVAAIEGLKANYGVAGEMLIRWLVSNREQAMEIREKTHIALKKEFASTNDERYWSAGNGCIIAIAAILGNKYSDIVDIPVKPIVESLRRLVLNGRIALRGSKRSAEDILNAYTRDNYGKFVVLKKVDGILHATLGGDEGAVDQSITRTQVAGRVEHGIVPGHIEYFIEESQLKQHCSSMSFGYSDLVDQLTKMPQYRIKFMKKNMLAKTRGPEMRMNVICISCPEALRTGDDAED
jgi:hypothetical protein